MAQVITIPTRPARIAALNHRYQHHAAIRVLRDALEDPELGRVAMVSSFGAESVVLLHMLSVAAPDTPVFILHLYDRALLNAAALRAVGYGKDTPAPPGGEWKAGAA